MFYFLDTGFWSNPALIVLFMTSLVAVIFGRYLIVSFFYQNVLSLFGKKLRNSFNTNSVQIKREIKWSFLSSLTFSGIFAGCFLAYQYNLTAIYTNPEEYSLLYFFFSPVLVLVLYETYYYWLHRWMHTPRIFKHIHKAHHTSVKPTVFTAFSFHPLEAFFQFIVFAILIFVLPIHPAMMAAVFTILTVFAVVNHSGHEVYSSSIQKHIIGSSHHDLHHKELRTNFGLNFTWWDKIIGTESTKGMQE